MSVLEGIAYYQRRNDKDPNRELARMLVRERDTAGVQEIGDHLSDRYVRIQSDCVKVLDEIGYLEPARLTEYVQINDESLFRIFFLLALPRNPGRLPPPMMYARHTGFDPSPGLFSPSACPSSERNRFLIGPIGDSQRLALIVFPTDRHNRLFTKNRDRHLPGLKINRGNAWLCAAGHTHHPLLCGS